MISLGAALLCDAATVRENLIHVLGGGISMLVRPDYPAPLGADIALVLYVAGDKDTTISHAIHGACREIESGEGVFDFDIDITTQVGSIEGPQSLAVVIPAENFGLPRQGQYEIVLTVDTQSLGVIPFSAL